jgi:hypothetical protein
MANISTETGCLKNVIKLSRTECECFETGKPDDYNDGQADIYLDELDGLQLEPLSASEGCGAGDIWDMMAKARANATQEFKNDLLTCLGSSLQMRRHNFSGIIGDSAQNATLNITNDKAGIAIRPYEIVGGYFELKRIGLLFNATSAITIKVYSNEDFDNEIASYSVNSTANVLQYVTLADPLKLPLWSNNVTNLEYYIVYELTGGFQPKNNKLECGCGRKNDVSFKNWITVHGIKGNVGTDYSNYTTSKEINGLLLDGSFTCDSSRLICSEEYPLDFVNGRGVQIAYAIRFRAAVSLIQKILDSGEINRYTLLGREALYGKRAHFQKEYDAWIVWLCENTNVVNTDCLMCKPNNSFVKGFILA